MSVPHLSKYPLVFLATLLAFFAALRPSASAHTPAPLPKAATAQDAQPAAQPAAPQPLLELRQAVAGERKDDPEAWFRLGVAYNVAGDAKEARKAFKQAVKLRPGFIAARAGVAYTLFSEGKLKDAHKEALQATRLSPNDLASSDEAKLAFSVSVMIHTEMETRAAAAELAKAERDVSKKPNDPRRHMRKAYALLRMWPADYRVPPDLTPPERPNAASPEGRAREAAL
ncbi:MAG TPA: tetratricopeptide repeat protein, partial [Pyrinomonadaceae bacterium]